MKKRGYRKYSKYSIENPEVWSIIQNKVAKPEAEFLSKLFKKYGKIKSVLDVGCGIGSHVNELSTKGLVCKGIDADSAKIKLARESYPKLDFAVGDMRNLREKEFDALIAINSILVFNKSNEEVIKTLKSFYNSLKKGGILIVEMGNPINHIENGFKKSFIDTGEDRKKFGIKAVYKEWINANTQTSFSKRTFIRLKDNKKVGIFQKESRMFFPQELKFFLKQSGFKVLDFYAGMTMKKDLNNSRRMLVVAKKKG